MTAGSRRARAGARADGPRRTPKGMHDVLWPESARWEDAVARFADLVEGAGYGLDRHPDPRARRRVPAAASARAARSSARRCTSSRTATAS